MIFFYLILNPAVPVCDFHIFNVLLSPLHEFITNYLLPAGLLAQLVECYTGIAEFKDKIPVQLA